MVILHPLIPAKAEFSKKKVPIAFAHYRAKTDPGSPISGLPEIGIIGRKSAISRLATGMSGLLSTQPRPLK